MESRESRHQDVCVNVLRKFSHKLNVLLVFLVSVYTFRPFVLPVVYYASVVLHIILVSLRNRYLLS